MLGTSYLSEEGLGAEEVVSSPAWGGLAKEGDHFSRTVSYPFTSLQGFILLLEPRKINVWKRDGKILTLATQEGPCLPKALRV